MGSMVVRDRKPRILFSLGLAIEHREKPSHDIGPVEELKQKYNIFRAVLTVRSIAFFKISVKALFGKHIYNNKTPTPYLPRTAWMKGYYLVRRW